MDTNACATSTRFPSKAPPSFFRMKILLGGLRHTRTSCCVLGCEIFSMRSSTSSRVHVNPSVRMTYMSGAASSRECSPTAETPRSSISALIPPLPIPSGPVRIVGALELDASSSKYSAPSYVGVAGDGSGGGFWTFGAFSTSYTAADAFAVSAAAFGGGGAAAL